MHVGEGAGGRERENLKAESLMSTEPSMGLGLCTLRSRPVPKQRVGCSTNPNYPGTP